MIELVGWLNALNREDRAWFLDWGTLWKGQARTSNCSMQMISPAFYERFVLPRDRRLFAAIGGGRMHYCGAHAQVIRSFFSIPDLSGFDYDGNLHDLWLLSDMAPERLTLRQAIGYRSPTLARLLAGDWPRKRNLNLVFEAPSIEEGRALLGALRRSLECGSHAPALDS